ncbi:M90 family metallopeptidase [Chitinilyticum piscinae]|uniref:Zinc-dependent peptidase n=1 Tax=Chitinilyticum piscinae TaxID=2866724 RepID=A0A8J7G310_9NEIS|nr:M90 family metallopeptidase [Chitinilyticum piscinae]MBE9610433.1 zinc-dependent peptidase [Chitinilyticum piscinae]
MLSFLKRVFSGAAGAQPALQLDDSLWQHATACGLFRGLTSDELLRLRAIADHFLASKVFTALDGLQPDAAGLARLAAQAALPVLNLGKEAYDDWQEVVLYPAQFRGRMRVADPIGVVHEYEETYSGMAHQGGALVLSWQDAQASPELDAWNVVIHELAHKLDMRNGYPNGNPPLHAGMDGMRWQQVFQQAYTHLQQRADLGHYTSIDPYAAESPAECFAVFSEYFFEWPHTLRREYPAVYEQLAEFYRQDPAARLPDIRYRAVPDEMESVLW